ncbi:class I SAM-dependent methyltransferase [Mastigocoleus sp. MO_188.B34]|uniref:class I SAM-dependent methyltransferase n=1 Tax=Mastigocoleus sp. MO_188.B34 TaxID=3036635 RepID=UPI00260563DF|nr:class I SAM-dependent methyltransferase [Mastigocoleus sp. MO_188.B34]MDJ0696705.1 class I SAM-dependent methyltransferase [Mastigocoleus sp. MO_188.B34]
MFDELETINKRPRVFEFYTASELWTDDYTSKQMLSLHLNKEIDVSSRNASFIKTSVEWIVTHFNVGMGSKVADFGCGPGLYTTKLAQKQAHVTGIDFSTRSIEYAREVAKTQGLSIDYVNENYLNFQYYDHFDLILMIMCDFCALSPSQRKKILTKFYKFLQPNGSILLDVYSLKIFEQREETALYEVNLFNNFWSENKYYGFLNTFKYEKEKVVLDKYTLIQKEGTRTIYNWLQCFSPEELKKEFLESGLVVEELYSDVAGSPFDPEGKEFAVVVKKA